jgi:hypothetical protein
MRDDMLPRFAKSDMPAKPAEEITSQPATPPVRTDAQTKPPAKTTKPRVNTRKLRG